MAELQFDNVSKEYPGGVIGCKDINLKIEDKEFCVLVGPSGCGKSTTLRNIAGLEDITSGSLYIDGKRVNDIPPKNRDIAMVFQNYALYPHMKVADNLAFGLKLRKYPKKEIKERVNEAAEILGITPLLDRRPKQLSGGQRQRVALGRAIVRKPKVFLFDEPLSNLDAKLRVQMRLEIKKLHAKLQTTMIYVTHDQVEAMTMGDKIVVMKSGYIQQVDEPIELYDNPTNRFVATFIGSPAMNIMEAKIVSVNDKIKIKGDGFNLHLEGGKFNYLSSHAGRDILMGIRPEDIVDKNFSKYESDVEPISAKVITEEPMGSENNIHATIGKSNEIIMKTAGSNRVEMGDMLDLFFKPEKIHFFDKKSEKIIQKD